ncbi:hypothetical protein DL96DRAFT_1620278 [Flagelloscypha sp. PMI_526]|nr:hypothetical protein DL96DRAFT_1620278 [Flagelloscypha sp. PMI_526]
MAAGFTDVEGPGFLSFCFNLILMGILIVQTYVYYVAFRKDHWAMKTTVYFTFVIELVQTVMMMVDRFQVFVVDFADVAALDLHLRMWFSVPILTGISSTVTQGFFAYRLYVLSKSWISPIIVIIGTLCQFAAALTNGIISRNLAMHEMPSTKNFVTWWCVSTAVTDVLIAILMTYHLLRMKTGIQQTDRLLTRIITLTIETGTLTAILAIIIVVLSFAVQAPWFFIFTDVIGKVYANNLLVMFNRRVDMSVGNKATVHHMSSSGLHGSGTLGEQSIKFASADQTLSQPSASSVGEMYHKEKQASVV